MTGKAFESATRGGETPPGAGRGLSVALVSSYPPTSCGLATFATALGRGLERAGASRVGVVRCLQGGDAAEPASADVLWRPGNETGLGQVKKFLDRHDVVLLQHEYGIYGPTDGVAVLDLLDSVSAPVISTLHTVPVNPSDGQRRILEAVVARSAAAVVMTEAARRRLVDGYEVDGETVHNIPHGATRPPAVARSGRASEYALTWGLLGPGKGIEWVVDALAMAPLSRLDASLRVVGRTHPKVAERDGDAYLDMLKRRSRMRGVERSIVFDTRYHALDRLLEIVAGASVVVLPYESTDQVTSGVLVDAITAGVPVVATRFPHAEELLGDGAGILVRARDPLALSEAIHRVMSDQEQRTRMVRRTRELADLHDWVTVARAYMSLAEGDGERGGDILVGRKRS